MPKHKKKKNLYQLQKIAKAHNKNEFFRKLQFVLNDAGCKHVYEMMPAKMLEAMYILRYQPLKVTAAEGQSVNPNMLKEIKSLISGAQKKMILPLVTGSSVNISLETFYTIVLSIKSFMNATDEDEFPNLKEIKQELAVLINDEETEELAYKMQSQLIEIMGIALSNLNSQLYWGKQGIKIIDKSDINVNVYNNLEIYCITPEKINIVIEGKSRPAIRAGFPFAETGIHWFTVKPSSLGIQNAFSELPLDVYIQSHALQRLYERIDCIRESIIYTCLFNSLVIIKAQKDTNGNILIEFRIDEKKVGYFRADIINGIIVIRTFLFILNTSTPEGEKLKEITGLSKRDEKYLSIDKLSSFMTSDIRNNKEIKKIFVNAGCSGLFEIDESLISKSSNIKEHSPAMMLFQYLGLNKITKGL
ncbi:MAG: hypothetical protein PHD97_07435 [Bacteroidales bacterium]|nr:hypothetical protein [Bacteroidales bacterium]